LLGRSLLDHSSSFVSLSDIDCLRAMWN